MNVTPLCDVLGAEVTGLDLEAGVDPASVRALNDALLRRHVLCVRSQPLEPNRLAAFARCFGEPQLQLARKSRHAEVPEVAVLDSTYKTAASKPAELKMMRLSGWHTDDSYMEIPAKLTVLHAHAVPSEGGQTRFCNTAAAYAALDPALKSRIDGLFALHGYDTPRQAVKAGQRTPEEIAETPVVRHPLVRTHDESGIKSIYFNPNRTIRIDGMQESESDALLDALYDHMTQTRFQYAHEWTVGDVLIWDNRTLVHCVNMDFPVGERRLHHRILIAGTRPR